MHAEDAPVHLHGLTATHVHRDGKRRAKSRLEADCSILCGHPRRLRDDRVGLEAPLQALEHLDLAARSTGPDFPALLILGAGDAGMALGEDDCNLAGYHLRNDQEPRGIGLVHHLVSDPLLQIRRPGEPRGRERHPVTTGGHPVNEEVARVRLYHSTLNALVKIHHKVRHAQPHRPFLLLLWKLHPQVRWNPLREIAHCGAQLLLRRPAEQLDVGLSLELSHTHQSVGDLGGELHAATHAGPHTRAEHEDAVSDHLVQVHEQAVICHRLHIEPIWSSTDKIN
mmetsp:Transcript_4530/g.10626  ORF Transcript_4530/g.10626 Transcript_4530/m.10626 type:complete len:282 (+) Transcript_4530:301-1146(+)